MLIVTINNPQTGSRIYSFRPWMVYQDQEDYMQLLNTNHILGEAKPDVVLADQYFRAVKSEQEHSEIRAKDMEKRIGEIADKILEYAKTNNVGHTDSDVSNITNVVRFDRNKMH